MKRYVSKIALADFKDSYVSQIRVKIIEHGNFSSDQTNVDEDNHRLNMTSLKQQK